MFCNIIDQEYLYKIIDSSCVYVLNPNFTSKSDVKESNI